MGPYPPPIWPVQIRSKALDAVDSQQWWQQQKQRINQRLNEAEDTK